MPEEYSSYFRSAIVSGPIEIVPAKKLCRLELIRLKYALDVVHEQQLARCGMRVTMYRLNIEHMSGKQAIVLVK